MRESARLEVQNVTRQDAGLYGCMVTNELGADSETSLLLYAGKLIFGYRYIWMRLYFKSHFLELFNRKFHGVLKIFIYIYTFF